MPRTYRAVAIGWTGEGDFGHDHDVVFKDLPGVEYVALSDPDEKGRAKAAKRAGVAKTYADYRAMLAKEKPDLVAIGPRHVVRRVEMVQAAAEAGAHVYCEKPLAGSLLEADQIVAACEKHGVKMAVGHQMRGMPPVRRVLADLRAGKYGRLVRFRARGKEDQRGGGEDLAVLGTHLVDLMDLFAGPATWVSASVRVGDRLATKADARQASEPVGRVAGDAISATFGFPGGVVGTFDSRIKLARPDRVAYGVFLECEEATIAIRNGDAHVYPSSVIVPENEKFGWSKVWVEEWHFTADHKPRPTGDRLHRGNQLLVRDLIEAVETGREPLSSVYAARRDLEMIQAVYASHLAGGARTELPLKERKSPLAG